jgi:zinc transport system permease protein
MCLNAWFQPMFDYVLWGILPLSLLLSLCGCFIVWHQKSYAVDALSHGVMLGSVVGDMYHLPAPCMSLLMTVGYSFLFQYHAQHILIMSYGSLAIAMLILSLHPLSTPLVNYLFGDIFLITPQDIAIVMALCVMGIGLLLKFYRQIILWTFDTDLAKVDGINVKVYQWVFYIILGLTCQIGMTCVGSLLLPMILVVPATVSYDFSDSPVTMLVHSFLVTAVVMILGLWAAWFFDVPSGISISTTAFVCYVLSKLKIKKT